MAPTLQATTEEESLRLRTLIAGRVISMEGRKLEEGDWTDAYCDARGIPKAGWSNLDIDVTYENVGLEQKMLRFDRGDSIATACGKWLMHPSLTRSIRVDQSMEANEAMVSVLGQYSALLDARRAKVESRYQGDKQIELRTGWLLWRSDLTEYLYFENPRTLRTRRC